MSLFVGHGFSRKTGDEPCLKFYMKKVVLLTYQLMPTVSGFDERITGVVEIDRCFRA
jgi:hypothetical protein